MWHETASQKKAAHPKQSDAPPAVKLERVKVAPLLIQALETLTSVLLISTVPVSVRVWT
jgi:hypothetical protein